MPVVEANQSVSLLTQDDLQRIGSKKIPKHIAFIPDGNRRWAKKNFVFPEVGHKMGADTLLNVIKASLQMGIETLTFFIFSTENWQRPPREIKAQMRLLKRYLLEQKQQMLENGVRFRSIGNLDKFPKEVAQLVQETVEATKHCSDITVIFAMNYGGRDDITRAIRKILHDYDQGSIKKNEIKEELVATYLDTAQWRDPDLLIRTSGESRLSNFLLWQMSYTEFFLCKVHWPEFTAQHLLDAVCDYQSRQQRRGR